jgi:hypothetical protein
MLIQLTTTQIADLLNCIDVSAADGYGPAEELADFKAGFEVFAITVEYDYARVSPPVAVVESGEEWTDQRIDNLANTVTSLANAVAELARRVG